MGLGSLFGGQPQAPSTQSVQYPAWESQYLQGLLNQASSVGQTPFTPYPGQLVADPSAMLKESWNMAQDNIGNYQPYMDQASQLTGEAAAPLTSSDISTFVNPYSKYITQSLDQNLKQNVLPGVRDQFVSSGQYGSSGNREMTERAVHDTQDSVGNAMAGVYQDAVNSLLQRRGQEGQLGAQYGQLGAEMQQLGLGDVSAVGQAGQQQSQITQAQLDAAHNEWLRQQMWPYQNVEFMADVLKGLPTQIGGETTTSWSPYQNGYSQSPFGSLVQFASLASLFGLAEGGSVGGALLRSKSKRASPKSYGALRAPPRSPAPLPAPMMAPPMQMAPGRSPLAAMRMAA